MENCTKQSDGEGSQKVIQKTMHLTLPAVPHQIQRYGFLHGQWVLPLDASTRNAMLAILRKMENIYRVNWRKHKQINKITTPEIGNEYLNVSMLERGLWV